MNLKKAKAIRKELFKRNVLHRDTFKLKSGELYNDYRREKNKLAKEWGWK